ncbi:MAG: PAS domain-containing protein [Candidatus Eisenbacteria bacterium]
MSSMLDDLFRFPVHESADREFVSHVLARFTVPAMVVDARLHIRLSNLQGREMLLKLQPGKEGARGQRSLTAFPASIKDDVKSCLKSGRAVVRSGFEIPVLHRKPVDVLMCPARIEDTDLCMMIMLRPSLSRDTGAEGTFDRLLASFDVAAVFIDKDIRVQRFNRPYLAAFARKPEEVTGVRVSQLYIGEQSEVLENQIRHLMKAGEARIATAEILPTAKMGVVSTPLAAWPFYGIDGKCRGLLALMEPTPMALAGVGADDVKQRLFGQVVELMRNAVVVTHLDGRILVMNRGAQMLVGPDTEIGRTDFKSAVPWSHPEIVQGLYDDVRKGSGYSSVLTDIDTPGGKRLLHVRAYGITELGDITSEVVFLLEDVTEEEQVRNLLSETARSLADEKALMDKAVEHSDVNFMVVARDLTILKVNDLTAKKFRMPAESLVGQKLHEFHPNVQKSGIAASLKEAMDTNREIHLPDFRHITRHGTELLVDFCAIPVRFNGEEACMLIVNDVPAGKRADLRSPSRDRLYEKLLNNVEEGVIVYDKDLRVFDCNHVVVAMARTAGEKYAQLTKEDLVGKHISDVMNIEQADLMLDCLRRTIDSGKPVRTGRVRLSRKHNDDEWYADISFIPLLPGEGPPGGVIGMARFSTKEKRLEQKLEDYTANLEELVTDRTHELTLANTLLETTVDRVESVAKSGMILSTLKNIESVMTSFLKEAREVLAADFISVALVESVPGTSKTTYYSSGSAPPSGTIPAEVIERGLSRLVLAASPPGEPRLPRPNVLTMDFAVGRNRALLLAWKAEGEFTSIDGNLGGLLCTQLSFSMPITTYLSDLRRERDRSQCLRQIAFRAAGVASVSGAIRIVAEEISRTVPADRFFWLVSNNDTDFWVSEIYSGAGTETREARRVGQGKPECLVSVLDACHDSHKLFCDRFPRFGTSDFSPNIPAEGVKPCPFVGDGVGEDLGVCLRGLLQNAGFLGGTEGTLAVVPVTLSSQSWGILCACSDVGSRFSREDSCFMCLAAATVGHMRQAADAASNARRLETAGQTVSELAHDLKYPLMKLKDSIANITCCNKSTVQKDPGLGSIAREIDNLNLLAQELIDISNVESHNYRIVDVIEVLDHCISLTSTDLAARSVKIERRGDGAVLPAIFVNPKDLKTVFLNVLTNCIDAAGEQGDVTIDVRQDGRRAGSETVCVTFNDSGPGVSEVEMARIFDPFYSRKDGGSGLGLFSAKKRANANGGDVICEMGENGKSRFVIWFPLASG